MRLFQGAPQRIGCPDPHDGVSGRRRKHRRPPPVPGLAVCVVVAALLAGLLTTLYVRARYFPGVPAEAGQAVVVEPGTTGSGGPVQRVQPAAALAVLEILEVKGRAPRNNYDRLAFGEAWLDVDANGCDTRNDVLRRDLRAVELVAGSVCQVAAGQLEDPYTGRMLDFSRGAETSKDIQIDHVVALGDAWQKGAQQLPESKRQSLANDPLNLIAVDGPTNVEKSDADAASWLPPNKAFRCQYVARQISVKAAYSLWITQAEKDAMRRVLSGCPGQRTQASGYQPPPVQSPQGPSATSGGSAGGSTERVP